MCSRKRCSVRSTEKRFVVLSGDSSATTTIKKPSTMCRMTLKKKWIKRLSPLMYWGTVEELKIIPDAVEKYVVDGDITDVSAIDWTELKLETLLLAVLEMLL